jgi:hypothetical protein
MNDLRIDRPTADTARQLTLHTDRRMFRRIPVLIPAGPAADSASALVKPLRRDGIPALPE